MDLYPVSPLLRFKIVLGPTIISWMDELILRPAVRMPASASSHLHSLHPPKSWKKVHTR